MFSVFHFFLFNIYDKKNAKSLDAYVLCRFHHLNAAQLIWFENYYVFYTPIYTYPYTHDIYLSIYPNLSLSIGLTHK